MGFLNSIIFAFAAFAAIPILIHLLNRRRVKKVYFSSLEYLKSLQKTRMRRLKIKQLLLLLIRILAVLFIVAAFARPALRGGYTAGLGAAAKTSAVIMLDNSLSMSAETREGSLFEQGQIFASSLLDAFSEGDEILFATFNHDLEASEDGFTLDLDALENSVIESRLSYASTDPRKSVDAAFEHLDESGNLHRELYIISDYAEDSWREFVIDRDDPESENTRVYLVGIADPEPDNIRTTDLDFGRQLIYPNRPVEITASFANDNPRRVSGVLASLFVDDKRISQTDFDIPASDRASAEFSFTFTDFGLHSGFVEAPDDRITADNRCYFCVSIPRSIKVLVIGENESDNHYLRLAIKPQPETPTQMEVRSVGMAGLPSEDIYAYDCIVLNGIDYMAESDFSRIENFVASGGNILIFAPPSGDNRFYGTRILERRFDADYLGAVQMQDESGYMTLERLLLSHPIFSRYSSVDEDRIPEIRFEQIMKIRPGQNSRTLAWFSSGDPAILESEWGQGRAILMASDLDPGSNRFINHPLFVTFVNRSIEYLSADLTRVTERYTTEDVIERSLSNIDPASRIELRAPDGSTELLAPNFSGNTAYLTIRDAGIPGIYRVSANDSTVDMFAVNIPNDETMQTYLAASDVEEKFSEYSTAMLSVDDDAFIEEIRRNRHGREIWKPVLIIGLLLLALEMVVARSNPVSSDLPNA